MGARTHSAPGGTVPAADHTAARVRLHGPRSQVAFDVLLDTLARPGTVRSLEAVRLPAGVPTPLVVPLAIADVEVSVAVVTADPDDPWAPLLHDITGARSATPAAASIVLLLDGFGAADVRALRRGSAEAPEGGARVAIACRALHADPGSPADADVVVELSGPGVPGTRRLGVDGLPAAVIDAVASANAAFPAGIDCWLADPAGRVAAVPRSSHVAVVAGVDDSDREEVR